MDISSILADVPSALVASAITAAAGWLFGHLKDRYREKASSLRAAATTATTKILPPVFRILIDFLIFWFLIHQLREVVTDAAPLTRSDALVIAFWTWWLMFFGVTRAFPQLFNLPRR